MFVRMFVSGLFCLAAMVFMPMLPVVNAVLTFVHALPRDLKAGIAAGLVLLAIIAIHGVVGVKGFQRAIARPGAHSAMLFGAFGVLFMALIPLTQWANGEPPSLAYLIVLVPALIACELCLWCVSLLTNWRPIDVDEVDPPRRVMRRITIMAPVYVLMSMWIFELPAVSQFIAPLDEFSRLITLLLGVGLTVGGVVAGFAFVVWKGDQIAYVGDDFDMYRNWPTEIAWIILLGIGLATFWNIACFVTGMGMFGHGYVVVPISMAIAQMVFLIVSWGEELRFGRIPAHTPFTRFDDAPDDWAGR